MEIFGKRNEKLEYKKRKGVYAVVQNDQGDFLVVKDDENYLYLVGGGSENAENAVETLKREALEEIGYKIKVNFFIGQSEKHWVSKKYPLWSQHNIGLLYYCDLLEKVTEPIESEQMLWVSFEELAKKLFHEHHLYLITSYLKNN